MKGNPQGGILSPFLWNCVLNNLLLELRNRGFYVQAYADNLAVLVTGADMLWIRGMAQKAINIATNWALDQELQFSSKKTEIILFTHKRNPDLGSLSMNGTKLELSKEARLLGVTLDCKLTWKPHITRITRKATTALMQCRQIVGKTWGIKPSMMKWIYTAMIRPIMSYACVPWAGGLNKKYLVRKLTKVQRLACLMISSAFPGNPTGALEILLNITPIEEFLLAEAVRGSYRITVNGLWHVNPIGSFGKTKSHVDVCNEARRFLPLLQMPADRIKKTKVFERNFECQIMDKKNAIRFESVLNQNTVKVYTDQRWSRGHKARGQGHKKNPRPRPRPRTAFPRTGTLEAKDRNARGQGQGPRTQAQVLSKKKKGLHKNFSGDLHKKMFSKKFFKRSAKF